MYWNNLFLFNGNDDEIPPTDLSEAEEMEQWDLEDNGDDSDNPFFEEGEAEE